MMSAFQSQPARAAAIILAALGAGWLTGRQLRPAQPQSSPVSAAPRQSPAGWPPLHVAPPAATAAALPLEGLSTPELLTLLKQHLAGKYLTAATISQPLLLLAERDPLLALDLLAPVLDGGGPAAYASLDAARALLRSLFQRQPPPDDAMLRQMLALDRYGMRAVIAGALAETQPERAMALWQERSAAGHREQAMFHELSSALMHAQRFDLVAALVDSLPATERDKWTRALRFEKLHASQIPDALAFIHGRWLPGAAWQSLARRFGALDPEAARAWALTRTADEQEDIWTGLAAVQAGRPEHLRQWLAEQPGGKARSILLGACLSQIPLTEALALLQSESALPGDIPRLAATMSGLILRDLPAAERWIAALPEGAGKQQLQERLASDWAGHDPSGWLEKLAALPDSDRKEEQVRAASRHFARTQPDAWLAWAETLDPGTRRELMDTSLAGVTHHDPARATQAAAGLIAAGDAGFTPRFEATLKAWTRHDFDAAAAWAAAAPEQVQESAARIIGTARQKMAADAARWLQEP